MNDQKPVDPSRNGKTVALGSDVQAKIGQYLRAMYDDVVKEGVPEHIVNMLRQIENPADEEPQK